MASDVINQTDKKRNFFNTDQIDRRGFPIEGAYFFHADHNNSIRFVTDRHGHPVTNINYLPYGEIDRSHSKGPDILRYKYTNQEEDIENGLYNFDAKLYNPYTARFHSMDKNIPGDNKYSQGLNRYMYTMGNPVSYVDPDGNSPAGWVALIVASPLLLLNPFIWGVAVITGISYLGGWNVTKTLWPYNYEGPTNNGWDSKPVSFFDLLGQQHDKSGAVWSPERFDEKTTGQIFNNIFADLMLILPGAMTLYFLAYVPIIGGVIAAGMLITDIVLSFQNYFEKLKKDDPTHGFLAAIGAFFIGVGMFILDAIYIGLHP